MAKLMLICGKLCCGKTTYAQRLKAAEHAVLLSSDAAVLRLFGPYLGDDHDRITGSVNAYLLDLALEILQAGTSVILDWGFWTEVHRQTTEAFFRSHGVTTEWHFVDVPEQVWRKNIAIRNQAVLDGTSQSFFVDEGLMEKFETLFQVPDRAEMDVWYCNDWLSP